MQRVFLRSVEKQNREKIAMVTLQFDITEAPEDYS